MYNGMCFRGTKKVSVMYYGMWFRGTKRVSGHV
jgi:hypothetical protein